jgi:hypothetical protein
MLRCTPEGTSVWFQLDARPSLKWPVELFLLYAASANREAAFRCELRDGGEITALTEQDQRELSLEPPRPTFPALLQDKMLKAKAQGAGK